MPQIRKPRFFQSSLSLSRPYPLVFAMSFTSHLGCILEPIAPPPGCAHNGSGITYSWSIFPGIKEEWNESSGRRRGGHFSGKGKKPVREQRERERGGGLAGGGEGEEREHPITAANTRATVIARPRPYLLFTWLPALCTRTTIPFQRLEPLETLARTRIATVRGRSATYLASYSSLLFLSALISFPFSLLVFALCFFSLLFPFLSLSLPC